MFVTLQAMKTHKIFHKKIVRGLGTKVSQRSHISGAYIMVIFQFFWVTAPKAPLPKGKLRYYKTAFKRRRSPNNSCF